MSVVKVLNNQTLIDLSGQLTGSVVNAILIAQENNINITEELSPGQILQVPEEMIIDSTILHYYTINELEPATGLTAYHKDIIDGCQGIGCWTIDVDFIVS
ncbi:hypothetical protein PL373_05910 [Tenacibaculum maritimum]|nr:hypothetical protein [Tenacibaculum maritimum]MDB0600685.1 hypothetical protein [Tenacibaculum maritimum]MDB0612668.1 hypothetical protein [Tenacibaculum maritimum]